MPALLEVKKISKSYQRPSSLPGVSTDCVLKDVSFTLAQGEILAIVGESGSGKSTLARQVVKLEQADTGSILLDGKPYASVADIAQRVRMVFQNSGASLNPRKRIYQILDEPLKNLTNLSRLQRSSAVFKCLQQVGLDKDQAQRYPHMLSGGQRQRVAIARALILTPQLILADEAVSALDMSVQAKILNLILDLRSDMGISWIFITHDISVVRVIADTVLVLYAGRVMEMGTVTQVLESPLHPYTQKLLQSVPRVAATGGAAAAVNTKGLRDQPLASTHGCVYLERCPIAGKACSESVPPMIGEEGHSAACFKAGSC